MLASLLLLKTDLRPPVSAGTMPSSTSAIRAVPASRLPSDDSLRDSNLLRGHLHPQHHRHHAQQCTVTTTGETTTASARTSSSDSSSCLCQLTKNARGDEKRASLDRPNPSTPTCCRTASAPCGHPPRSSCFSSSSSSSSAWSPLVLLILLTSLGVTLAMPLSDNEKHYRELQSRAVVSGRRLFFLFVLFFVCCCFSFCVERLSRTQLMQRLCSRATHSLCHLPLLPNATVTICPWRPSVMSCLFLFASTRYVRGPPSVIMLSLYCYYQARVQCQVVEKVDAQRENRSGDVYLQGKPPFLIPAPTHPHACHHKSILCPANVGQY